MEKSAGHCMYLRLHRVFFPTWLCHSPASRDKDSYVDKLTTKGVNTPTIYHPGHFKKQYLHGVSHSLL